VHKTIVIDGGAGRVIAAIPALIKYINNNPNDDIKILVYGWSALFYGIKSFAGKVFEAETLGAFENYFKHCDEVIKPEPYRQPSYFKQEKSLVETFDEVLNKTNDHGDILAPQLVISPYEKENAKLTLQEMAKNSGKNKIVIIQPFGRSTEKGFNKIYDSSSRSIPQELYLTIVKELSKDFAVLFLGEEHQFVPEDKYTAKFGANLRAWLSLISECTYFIGCDSFGQHAARALNKQGTVFIGSTFKENVTYTDFFHIVEKVNAKKLYSPLRLAEQDMAEINTYNQDCFNYSKDEIKLTLQQIKKNINEGTIEYSCDQSGPQRVCCSS